MILSKDVEKAIAKNQHLFLIFLKNSNLGRKLHSQINRIYQKSTTTLLSGATLEFLSNWERGKDACYHHF